MDFQRQQHVSSARPTDCVHRSNSLVVTIFLVVSLSIFLLPNRVFAWFEYYSSLVKIFLFLIIIFTSLAVVCGAGDGDIDSASYWTDFPPFKNGFSVS